MREFAKKIGVSPTAVSLTLSGQGRIGAATRAMVLEKMQELGYTPNMNARRLGTGRSYLIALHPVGEETLDDLYMLQLTRAILQEVRPRGYDLLFDLATEGTESYDLMRRRANSRAVDGTVMFGAMDERRDFLYEIAQPHHPCVVIGHAAVEGIPHMGSVVLGLRTGVRQIAKLFLDNGHRRIGFIDQGSQDDVIRYFAEELSALGLVLAPENVAVMGPNAEHGAEGLRKLMSQPLPPTAVFARTDILALGALREAKLMGLEVPGDVSIVGHDDLPPVMLAEPTLTTVHVDIPALGKAAVDVLFRLMGEPDTVVPPQIVETALVARETVGPAPCA